MTFQIGQKVVCIARPTERALGGEIYPDVGEVYTVRDIRSSIRWGGDFVIRLNEIRNPERRYKNGEFTECWFRSTRFRPVAERKTDITVFTEILRRASKPARAPALSSPK